MSDPSPAPPRRRLTTVLAVLGWCAVVAVAATVGWVVVDRAGVPLVSASGLGLTAPNPSATATTPTSAAGPGGSASLLTVGGRVTGRCTPGGDIFVVSAIPVQGWRVEIKDGGPDRLKVELSSGAHEIEVTGRCQADVAVLAQGARGSASTGSGGATTAPGGAGGAGAPTRDDHGGGSTKSTSGSGKGGGGSSTSGSGRSSGGGSSGGSRSTSGGGSGSGSGGGSGGGDDKGGGN